MNTVPTTAAILIALGVPLFAYTTADKHTYHPDDEWYRGAEAKTIAEFVISWQSPEGGWPKNPIDTGASFYAGEPARIRPTFDNGATSMEMRYLGRIAGVTKEPKYIASYLKGLDYILDAQYDNGGWPQSHPPDEGYGRYITFNDGAMVRIMFVLDEIIRKPNQYDFVPAAKRKAAQLAWDKGVEAILECQVKVDGKLTAWCSQHDEKDFSPRPARTFEPVALTASESIGIVHVLMAEDKPTAEIIAAVDAAYQWLDQVKLTGIRVEDKPKEGTPRGYERYVIADPSAPPQWARFYEIGTNKPVFADRDGVVKYDLGEIGVERRTGYKWYGTWPKAFLTSEYPEWKKRVSGAEVPKP